MSETGRSCAEETTTFKLTGDNEWQSRCVCRLLYKYIDIFNTTRQIETYISIGRQEEVVIAIIMCVIKPSALLAIRITVEHNDGTGCYCLFSSLAFAMLLFTPKPIFRTVTHIFFARITATTTITIISRAKWKQAVNNFGILFGVAEFRAYLYFHLNLTFQFRHIVAISLFNLISLRSQFQLAGECAFV